MHAWCNEETMAVIVHKMTLILPNHWLLMLSEADFKRVACAMALYTKRQIPQAKKFNSNYLQTAVNYIFRKKHKLTYHISTSKSCFLSLVTITSEKQKLCRLLSEEKITYQRQAYQFAMFHQRSRICCKEENLHINYTPYFLTIWHPL